MDKNSYHCYCECVHCFIVLAVTAHLHSACYCYCYSESTTAKPIYFDSCKLWLLHRHLSCQSSSNHPRLLHRTRLHIHLNSHWHSLLLHLNQVDVLLEGEVVIANYFYLMMFANVIIIVELEQATKSCNNWKTYCCDLNQSLAQSLLRL